VTDNVYCLVKIIEKDERIIAAVQFEIKLFAFFYQSKQFTDYIYTDIYCKLSKCTGQTPCSYEHYIVVGKFSPKSAKFAAKNSVLKNFKSKIFIIFSIENFNCLTEFRQKFKLLSKKNATPCPTYIYVF